MVAHTYIVPGLGRPKQGIGSTSNQEFKASSIHSKFKVSLDYRVRHCLKNL